MKLIIDSKEINFFKLNEKGKIIESGDINSSTWDKTYIDLKSIEIGKPPLLTFQIDNINTDNNVKWVKLNYNILKIL